MPLDPPRHDSRRGQMVRSACFALALGLACIAQQAAAQTWAEYRPEGVGYAVEMPGQWTVTSQDTSTAVGSVKVHMATVDMGAVAYMSMYNEYPAQLINGNPVAPILDGARNGAVQNVKGTLRQEDKITISNLEARQLVIDSPRGIVIKMRYFLLANVLVQALVAGPPGIEDQPEAKRFLDSLKVVPK
jgi:hypothetical protein